MRTLLIPVLFLAGCYTQFAALDRSPDTPPPQPEVVVDSAGDTVKVVQQTDTVEVREREVCYWQRDFFGRPVLRCYTTYYDDDWLYYHDYPWWYRDYSYYSSYSCHCPYHTRYNPHCSYCWDYCHYYYHDNYRSGGSGGYHSGGTNYPSTGGTTTPTRSSSPSRSTGTSSRSGQKVNKGGGGKPLIAGPMPEAKQSPQPLPKETTEKSGSSVSQGSSSPPPARTTTTRDTTRTSRPRQPRRRHGRTR